MRQSDNILMIAWLHKLNRACVSQQTAKLEKQKKRAVAFPQRKYAVKA